MGHFWVEINSLALSSYFWAPLVEARPQQWGQILVFLGVISACLWLHRLCGLVFFLIMPCIAFTHILSHAVLIFLCGMLVVADFIEKKPLTQRHLSILLTALFSLGIYLIPDGPYASMLVDLEQIQMKRFLQSTPYLAIPLSTAAIVLIYAQRKWHWRPSWTNTVAVYIKRRRIAIGLSLVCIICTLIAMQATLLPTIAWTPYNGSWLRFLIFQSGNLMFASFFVLGAFDLVSGLHSKQLNPAMGRLLIWILIALGILSIISITISWWLLHTNWFLRILNYGIFFAAIVTAIGIDRTTQKWSATVKYTILSIGIVVSILAVVRPQQLLGC